MKLQPVSLLVALTFIIAVPAQASEVVIQDKNRINSAQVNNKPDIEDYDTLNYIGLDKARQQLSVYQN
ncbi:hypothetical protein GNZ42_19850, partial [Salmonella enterica]|nr:hypothetical protein [Salmonella enterica]